MKYYTYYRGEARDPRSCSLPVNLERTNRVAVRNLCPLFQCPPIKLLNSLKSRFYEVSNITIRGKILIEISMIMSYLKKVVKINHKKYQIMNEK